MLFEDDESDGLEVEVDVDGSWSEGTPLKRNMRVVPSDREAMVG